MSLTHDHGADDRSSQAPLTPGPATSNNIYIQTNHATVAGNQTTVGGDVQVAGRDARKASDDPPARPWLDLSSWSLLRWVASGFTALLISIVAGFVVYFWTLDDGTDQPSQPPTTVTTVPATNSPVTTAPATTEGVGAPPGEGREGIVQGCNTYGENCDDNPLYQNVPPPSGYDWATWPTIAKVPNGSTLLARCWALGAVTTNYAETDHGPDPYASEVYFNVKAGDGRWGWIPDTYFVRDQAGRMGLPKCSATTGA